MWGCCVLFAVKNRSVNVYTICFKRKDSVLECLLTKHLSVLIHIRNKSEAGTVKHV